MNLLLTPLRPNATALFYYHQRIRHAGSDIERMMNAAGMSELASSAAAALLAEKAATAPAAEPEEQSA